MPRHQSSFWPATLLLAALAAAAMASTLGGSLRKLSGTPISGLPAIEVRVESFDDPRDRGLEVRIAIGPVRVDFPWMRWLPVQPGRRVLVFVRPPR